MAKQLPIDRARRLKRGGCPIHGHAMWQVGVACDEHGERVAVIVECPRKDCRVQAYETEAFRDAELTPEWEHLLELEPEPVGLARGSKARENATA